MFAYSIYPGNIVPCIYLLYRYLAPLSLVIGQLKKVSKFCIRCWIKSTEKSPSADFFEVTIFLPGAKNLNESVNLATQSNSDFVSADVVPLVAGGAPFKTKEWLAATPKPARHVKNFDFFVSPSSSLLSLLSLLLSPMSLPTLMPSLLFSLLSSSSLLLSALESSGPNVVRN